MNKKNAARLVNQDSGNTEWYTDPKIVSAARAVFGGQIDLDPASSLIANVQIKATHIFTEDDDGLSKPWFGHVWMNHPFGKLTNKLWVNKIEEEYTSGRVVEACCITFAATSERWFQPLIKRPQCYLCPRTNYYLPNGQKKNGVTKGSVVTYFGTDPAKFALHFTQFGEVKISI
jgi:hypothetical protein